LGTVLLNDADKESTSAAAELVLSNVTQQAQTLAKTLLALRETGAVTPAQLQIAVKSATSGTGMKLLYIERHR
jgi:hypothetical protein